MKTTDKTHAPTSKTSAATLPYKTSRFSFVHYSSFPQVTVTYGPIDVTHEKMDENWYIITTEKP